MRTRLIFVLAILVVTPLALLAWIGAKGVHDEREAVASRIEEFHATRLRDAAQRIEDFLGARARDFERSTEDLPLETDAIRAWLRRTPFAGQAFVLGPDEKRLHPPPEGSMTEAEAEFLERASQAWRDRDRFYRVAEGEAPGSSRGDRAPSSTAPSGSTASSDTTAPSDTTQSSSSAADLVGSSDSSHTSDSSAFSASSDSSDSSHSSDSFNSSDSSNSPLAVQSGGQAFRRVAPGGGWYAWYQGGDLSILRWRRFESDHVLAVEMNRSRFLADIVSVLPSGDSMSAEVAESRIRLLDSRGEILYQWGGHSPRPGEVPAAVLRLEPPLSAWTLAYFAADESMALALSRNLRLQLWLGILALGLVLGGLGAWFWRESTRELRDARQRVTFVNQVSHELKTPLTNIRMYGELLQDHGNVEDAKSREYIDTIVLESQRLSRLIGNVLTFARGQREGLRLHPRVGVVDEIVAGVIERFRPLLLEKGIEVRFEGGAPGRVKLDPDALEQILGNLLGNVEKYAPGSGVVEVTSGSSGSTTRIVVADRGPGIPAGRGEEIFEPFRRLSDKITEGVAGTGLGLSIARELARLHGGDVRLLSGEGGARFEVTLETPGETA